MKLRRARIENFAVFKTAELTPVGDLTVIVGRNGSGKSFLLEALNGFFTEFQLAGGASAWQKNPDFWYARETKNPIQVAVELELSKLDLENILAAAPEVLDEVHAEIGEEGGNLVVQRQLISEKGWRTVTITLAGRELVTDDSPVSEVIVKRPRKPDPALDRWSLVAFPPSPDVSWQDAPRLLLDKESGQAFQTDDRVDALVQAGVIDTVDPQVGVNPDEWASSQGHPLVGRPPEDGEAPELEKAHSYLKRHPADAVSAALLERIKASWDLVPAVREEVRTPGHRDSPLPAAMVNEMNTELADRTPGAEQRARWLEGAFLRFTSKRLDFHPQGLLVDDDRQRLPFGHQGGGEQAVLGLVKRIMESSAILAVEEPEAHLHPKLARDLFRFLRERSGQPQIIISTHSPMMMDKQTRTNNWLCRVTPDGSSVLERLEEQEDIRLTLAELGSVPSDAYTKDVVLLAEGATETEAAFPIWAVTLGRPFPDNVGLIALGGKGKVKGHLQTWLNIMDHSSARYLVALDANAPAEKQEVLRTMRVRQDAIRLMPWQCLEDTFPDEIVRDVLLQLFGIDLNEDKTKLPKEGREAFIKKLLRGKKAERPHWKMDFASAVSIKMTTKQIPKEFSGILDSLYEMLP